MRSIIPDFDLVNAADLPSALELLSNGEGWRPIAGGTDLMVLLNAGRLPHRRLVSIRSLEELRCIQTGPNSITIGAAATYTQIRENAELRRNFSLLCDAASWTGGVAIQHRGTLGGNIVNASPAADSAPVLLIFDAALELISRQGVQSLAYEDFHSGYRVTRMRHDEVLRSIRLPLRQGHWRYYIRKVGARKAQAISKVCIAAGAKMAGTDIEDVRIAFGSVAPIPLRCFATEQVLRGKRLDSFLSELARNTLRNEITPISDIRSTARYRSEVAVNLLGDFLKTLR